MADEPSPQEAALLCERGGADGITVHLREDRRHIQDRDVRAIADTITSALNLELATATDILQLAVALKPDHATLVPEKREEITTEGGLDLGVGGKTDPKLIDAIDRLNGGGITVSLFIDPDLATIDRAAELDAPAIELHTGDYANRPGSSAPLERLRQAALHAKAAGLAVHAGHGLTYLNVQPVAAITEVEELNIGHTIVSRSITVGMEEAVREMRSLVDSAR